LAVCAALCLVTRWRTVDWAMLRSPERPSGYKPGPGWLRGP